MPDILSVILIVAVLGQAASIAALWRKIGNLENAIKKACPFGGCPFYERAMHEAAPERDILLRLKPVIERVNKPVAT